MDQWTRRDLMKLGVLSPAGVTSLKWTYADTERNLSLNRAAWASSSADFIHTGHMATDGQSSTLWSSANADPQWIYIDLGAFCKVRSVVLRWGANYALAYKVQVSGDSEPSSETGLVEGWIDNYATSDGKGGVERIRMPETHTRCIRLVLNKRVKLGGYELSAFEVYGIGELETAHVPMPSPERASSVELSGGWRLMNQAFVPDEATAISTRGYDDSKWLMATVPGTVLTSYLNVGAIPDPFYGDHQLQVSDFFAHTNWWYRNELDVPSNFYGKHIWLNFDGINYRAYIYVNGKPGGNIAGAFIRGRFDVSELIVAGRKNCVAVLIIPVPKPDKVNVKTLSGYKWPEEYPKNEPTILAAASWDWLPTIRDRDMGIWNHVTLTATGDVTIENPFVVSRFPEPQDLSRVDITLKLDVKNHSDQPRKGVLKARLGNIELTRSVALQAGKTMALSLDKSTHPQFSLVDPQLWWPSGYGEQNLYDLTLEFTLGDQVSYSNKTRVGIREYTYNQPSLTQWAIGKLVNGVAGGAAVTDTASKEPLTISCNGRRIFVRGVNWGMDEGMLRCDRRGFEDRLRMEKEMNFNLIRNWAGNLDKSEFFELCDEYGLMVWEEFGMANQLNPDDPEIWLANAQDRLLRRRNYACIVLWCAGNESIPEDPILTEMPNLVEALDGTRLFLQCSTQVPPTNGDGPYDTHPPSFYFKDFAHGFRPEIGSPTVPSVESMRRMMPHDRLWPSNDVWGMHDWWLGVDWGGTGLCAPTEAAIAAYGTATGIEDFCRKAQMVNMEVFKAIYEAWNHSMWDDCTGIMLWMSNPAWPSLSWNTYDYYMEPTAAYFACKKACEPIHIQWNIASNEVKAVNCTLNDFKGLNAEAAIYNLDGSLFVKKSAMFDCPANSAQGRLQIFVPDEDKVENLSNVHFIKLTLKDGKGELLSHNFYWRGKKEWKYEELQSMEQGHLTGTMGTFKNGHIDVDLKNQTSGIALMVRLKLVDLMTGLLVAPIIYSDNYFSLTPYESRHIDIHLRTYKVVPSVALIVEGWNIAPQELGRFGIPFTES